MKINLSKTIALVASVVFSYSAMAKTVYLSATGSDENDGTTQVTAFASLEKTVSVLEAGDIVMVEGMVPVSTAAEIANLDDVSFVGTSADDCGFYASYLSRIFKISQCNFKLYNLKLKNGYCEGTPGGGAIYQDGGTLTIENCVFEANKTNLKSNSNGGAIRTKNCELSMINCELFYNRAFRGGAVEAEGGNATFDGCVFVQNYTRTYNEAANGGAGAGAIFINDVENTLINDCTIDSNKAWGMGGALYVNGNKVKNFRILSSAITNNTAGEHGGMMMFNLNSNPDLRVVIGGTTIAKNSCKSAGGVALFESGGVAGQEISFVNCTLTANETKSNVGNSGGITLSGDKKPVFNIINTIIEGNWAAGNNRYSDGWWKATTFNIINSFVGYVFECNGENNKHFETNYNISENSHWFTTQNGADVMQSGISTEADCDGYCYPLYPGSEATTMGDVALANSYGVEYDQKGNKYDKPYIGAVQLVLGDVIPSQKIGTGITDIEMDSHFGTSGKASRYELYTLSGQKIGTYQSEPNLAGKKGAYILVRPGDKASQSTKIINN